ncbi:hypothetical protein BDA96_02G385300 [Sorghum bicolor]|uniref:Uncharacterized protein n=1 Tax=Sorghum bicolor TaxID=4558 RepID=A0A921RU11_SORBI|nr:hypothetical protein BDA96_02G385300 [Sorghum bicolor]
MCPAASVPATSRRARKQRDLSTSQPHRWPSSRSLTALDTPSAVTLRLKLGEDESAGPRDAQSVLQHYCVRSFHSTYCVQNCWQFVYI